MKNKIITAAEARNISEGNKDVDFGTIMGLVTDFAAQGRTEFEICNKSLFKKWEVEIINLGYAIKKNPDGIWILSWGSSEESDKYSEAAGCNNLALEMERKAFNDAKTWIIVPRNDKNGKCTNNFCFEQYASFDDYKKGISQSEKYEAIALGINQIKVK